MISDQGLYQEVKCVLRVSRNSNCLLCESGQEVDRSRDVGDAFNICGGAGPEVVAVGETTQAGRGAKKIRD